MVNVGRYTIHGFYGIYLNFFNTAQGSPLAVSNGCPSRCLYCLSKVLAFMRPRWGKPLEEILHRLIGSVSTFVPFMIVLYFLVKLLGRDHPTVVVPVYELSFIDQIVQLHILLKHVFLMVNIKLIKL